MTTWRTQPPARWSWRKLAPLIRSGFENGKGRRRRRSNAELAPWSKKRKAIAVLADKDNSQLLPRMRDLIEDLRAEWRGLDDRIAAFDAEFVRLAREDVAPGVWRRTVRGRFIFTTLPRDTSNAPSEPAIKLCLS